MTTTTGSLKSAPWTPVEAWVGMTETQLIHDWAVGRVKMFCPSNLKISQCCLWRLTMTHDKVLTWMSEDNGGVLWKERSNLNVSLWFTYHRSFLWQWETTNGSFSVKRRSSVGKKKTAPYKYKLRMKWPSLIEIGLELSVERLSSPWQACHFYFAHCRRSIFIEDRNHRPKPQLLLITIIIQG